MFIHIEASTLSLAIVYIEALDEIQSREKSDSQPYWSTPAGWYARIEGKEGTIFSKIYLDCEKTHLSNETLTAIFLGNLSSEATVERMTLLYVEEHNSGYAERVGGG